MKPLTVDELRHALTILTRKGYGDYPIFVADDEEGNGYHGLWYGPEAASEMDPENRKIVEEINNDLCCLEDKDKAVYMG